MLEVPDAVLPVGATWVPCCVGFRRLPGRRQGGDGDASDSGSDSSSDTDADTAARQPRRVPLLVGPWDRVQVDPTAWGYGKKDLLTFAVKAASFHTVFVAA